jgi:hypothetical protein
MKKILLLTIMAATSLLASAQLPPTLSSSTPDGPGAISVANCIFAAGTPQSCPHICRNSVRLLQPTPNNWTFYFEFYQVTSGAKSMQVYITCEPAGTVLVNDCLDVSAIPSNTTYGKTYSFTSVCGFSNIKVQIQAHTNGSCGGTVCGPLLISTGGGALPVEMKSFTASRNSSNVNLEWVTSSEFNNRGFAVERNSNGAWEQIAFVDSRGINGASDAEISYSFVDRNYSKGISQYRIKQVDFDASYKFSEVRLVRGEGLMNKSLVVFPNPSNDGKVTISFEDASSMNNVTVIDMNGRTVKQYRGITNNSLVIENLQPGMYTVKVLSPSTGEQAVQKIVVNKR